MNYEELRKVIEKCCEILWEVEEKQFERMLKELKECELSEIKILGLSKGLHIEEGIYEKIYESTIKKYNIISIYMEIRKEFTKLIDYVRVAKEEVNECYKMFFGFDYYTIYFYITLDNFMTQFFDRILKAFVLGNVLNQITKKKIIFLKTPGLSMDVKECVLKFIF